MRQNAALYAGKRWVSQEDSKQVVSPDKRGLLKAAIPFSAPCQSPSDA